MSTRLLILPLACVAILSGCGAGGSGSSAGAVDSANVAALPRPVIMPGRSPARRPTPTAQVQTLPGLGGVIGATPAELVRQFGSPRLDVWEGDARKLQYSGRACVLDIYLYPPTAGREPQATYVDARRASDGQDVDRAACIAAMRGTGTGGTARRQ